MGDRINFYLHVSGIATAIVVMAISGMVLQNHHLFWEAMIWQSAIAILFLLFSSPWLNLPFSRWSYGALWLLLPAIFGLAWRVHIEFFFIYTIVWIACAPIYLSRPWSWLALVLLNFAWYVMRVLVWSDSNPFSETLLVATFHVFALLSALVARVSVEANEKTQTLNRELLATQHLLAEASRDGERTRIARDLHDLLGHHLTAMTINLQVAERMAEGKVKDKIVQCHALSKLLLNDVREAVSTLREMPVVSLRELLQITIRDIPRLEIELHMENDISLNDVNVAEVLLRCVQEAITNTLKHSKASRATISVITRSGMITVDYRDNGQGSDKLEFGNGLRGMQERLESVGGELQIVDLPEVNLTATIPLAS